MKRLIRNRSTKLYLQADGTWTSAPEAAAEFPHAMAALEAQRVYALKQVELVLQIESRPNPSFDIVLPLTDWPALILKDMERAQGTAKVKDDRVDLRPLPLPDTNLRLGTNP